VETLRSNELREFEAESVFVLRNAGGAVPEWEDVENLWTEVEQEARFEKQFESGAASIWK
jgi:hypothetical protein